MMMMLQQRIFMAQIKWQDRIQHLSHSISVSSLFDHLLCLSTSFFEHLSHFYAFKKQILSSFDILTHWHRLHTIFSLLCSLFISFTLSLFFVRPCVTLYAVFAFDHIPCINGLRAFVCIDQLCTNVLFGTCICWLRHDCCFFPSILQRTCFDVGPLHAFSWASIRFECISTVIVVIAFVFCSIRT